MREELGTLKCILNSVIKVSGNEKKSENKPWDITMIFEGIMLPQVLELIMKSMQLKVTILSEKGEVISSNPILLINTSRDGNMIRFSFSTKIPLGKGRVSSSNIPIETGKEILFHHKGNLLHKFIIEKNLNSRGSPWKNP